MVSKSIKGRIDEAVKVSEDYPEALRATILGYLLNNSQGEVKPTLIKTADRGTVTDTEVAIEGALTALTAPRETDSTADEGTWFAKLSQESGVSPDHLRQIYDITDDGKPHVRVILKDDSVPKRQIGYSVLHLIAAEKSGVQGATSDQLRELVKDKKAYDTGNFARNFKQTDNLRPYGNPGRGDTEWVLTSTGREEAKRLIKQLCSVDAS
jgi:hypothetical protein